MAKLIGYQIANVSGENIQGDGVCPVDFASFEVLSPAAANAVMAKLAAMDMDGDYLLQPIVEGDVEDHQMIDHFDGDPDDTDAEFVILTGSEGEEDDPIYCPTASEKDAAVIAAEDRGEFCVVHRLGVPSYTTA